MILSGSGEACDELDNSAVMPQVLVSTNAPPSPAGGRIVDGVYHWKTKTYYDVGPQCVPLAENAAYRYTLEFVNSTTTGGVARVHLVQGTTFRYDISYSVVGTQFVPEEILCGYANVGSFGYTATPSTFGFFTTTDDCGTIVDYFERQ